VLRFRPWAIQGILCGGRSFNQTTEGPTAPAKAELPSQPTTPLHKPSPAVIHVDPAALDVSTGPTVYASVCPEATASPALALLTPVALGTATIVLGYPAKSFRTLIRSKLSSKRTWAY